MSMGKMVDPHPPLFSHRKDFVQKSPTNPHLPIRAPKEGSKSTRQNYEAYPPPTALSRFFLSLSEQDIPHPMERQPSLGCPKSLPIFWAPHANGQCEQAPPEESAPQNQVGRKPAKARHRQLPRHFAGSLRRPPRRCGPPYCYGAALRHAHSLSSTRRTGR